MPSIGRGLLLASDNPPGTRLSNARLVFRDSRSRVELTGNAVKTTSLSRGRVGPNRVAEPITIRLDVEVHRVSGNYISFERKLSEDWLKQPLESSGRSVSDGLEERKLLSHQGSKDI
jgi:hypothetical protein